MIKTNLKGAAGVQINIKDVSGRPNTKAAPYRIGLVGWTPKGPSNIPVVVTTESDLYSIFGTPKGFKPSEVYLLHNAKILLNAGAEVVIVRTVQTATEETQETLNLGVYLVPSSGAASLSSPVKSPKVYLYEDSSGTLYKQTDGITYNTTDNGTLTKYKVGTSSSPGAFIAYERDATDTSYCVEEVYIVNETYIVGSPVGLSYNMDNVLLNKQNQKLTAADHQDSPFTMFLKYPGFNKFFAAIRTFEVGLETYLYPDVTGTLYKQIDGITYSTAANGTTRYKVGTSSSVDAFLTYSMNGVYYELNGFEAPHTLNADPSDIWYSSEIASYKSYVQGLGVYSAPYTVDVNSDSLIYGDVWVKGAFRVANGVRKADLDKAELNETLNLLVKQLIAIRVYESKTSQTPIETLYATLNEFVTDYGDQLEITSVASNLLNFKKRVDEVNLVTTNTINKSVSRTELTGGTSETHPNRSSKALSDAWGMFGDTTNVDVSLLVDGGSSIANFGDDRENAGFEQADMAVVTAMLNVSSARMDAPCVLDLPKRSKVNDLVTYFKKYPSVGNEVDGSTASYATFWGNAQDGRQIINDTFNKKQIEAARSVFKAVVAYNVFNTSYPWQTQWGPNRGLITSPSVGTINPRTYPDEVGLLSQNRINPSRLTTTGEYFWDDYTLMAKSSVLQRWHAVCFLANLNKRYRKMLEQYVAELNTPALRKTIWNMLNDDLNYIMNHADPPGLYNYYVICDETNNTPEVIDAGQLNVDVGLEIVRDTRVINLTTTLYKPGGIVKSGIKV